MLLSSAAAFHSGQGTHSGHQCSVNFHLQKPVFAWAVGKNVFTYFSDKKTDRNCTNMRKNAYKPVKTNLCIRKRKNTSNTM